MLKTILAIILAWSPTYYPDGAGPETPEARQARRTIVAEVVSDVANQGITELWPRDNAATLLTIMKFESNLDYYVHGGEPAIIGTQDGMKARCLGQIHRGPLTHLKWVKLAGRDKAATARCARRILHIIWYHTRRCKLRYDLPQARRWRAPMTSREAGIVMAAYGSGNGCKPQARMKPRIKMWKRLHEKLP